MAVQVAGSQRRVLGLMMIGGAGVAAAGAVLASTYGVWGLGRAERIEQLAGEPLRVWIWGNILLGLGVVITAAGVAALAGLVGSGVARAGGALVVVAGAVAAIGFLFQGVGGAQAAELLVEAGQIPDGFFVTDAIQDGLLVLFGGVMALGTLAVGFGSLYVEWLPRYVGLAAGAVSLLALALLPFNIPFVALLGALVFGVGLLIPNTARSSITGIMSRSS